MSNWRETWKDKINVEIHLPGFDINKSIGRARRLADKRRAEQAGPPTTPASPTPEPAQPQGPQVEAFAPGDPDLQVGMEAVHPPFELTL